ncbi:hypothetical protein OG555_18790 [Kribbella sp. NBC_01484]|uniref:hypothetical protein n=1 Tax=Kribbella sp. NBC_01484 TaxID=2903579 RepID=UPI002E3001FE|nr:hypothetical protein [Kribbella sp. NBC_01484]
MTITDPAADPMPRHRVRVWFGDHVIADYLVRHELAERYAAASSRRFGLPVTIDAMPRAIRIDGEEQ